MLRKEPTQFGINVRYLREQYGMTRQELAEDSGLSASTLNFVENGYTKPSHDTILSLSDYFEISIDHLMRGELD